MRYVIVVIGCKGRHFEPKSGAVFDRINLKTDAVYNFLLMLGLILFCCLFSSIHTNQPFMNLSYLALGDSYTVGECVPAAECFPALAAAQLRAAGVAIDEPRIIAVTGWTTDELQAGIQQAGIQGNQYDFVSLLIGVNNQYRGRSVEEYKTQFTGLLEQAIGFCKKGAAQVVVLSIPDWGVTPFAADRDAAQIAREIDLYNSCNKAIAAQYHVRYVDITPFTREAKSDPSLLASDGLHPSGKDYSRWAALLSPLFKEMISGKQP